MWDEWELKVQDLEGRNMEAIEKKSIYENLDFDSWAQDSYKIAKTLYDSKFKYFESELEFNKM